MTKETFFAQLNEIDPADVKAMEKAADRQAKLAKPPGSLGVLVVLRAGVGPVRGASGGGEAWRLTVWPRRAG